MKPYYQRAAVFLGILLVWATLSCSDTGTGPLMFPDEPAPDPQPEVVAFVDVGLVTMAEDRVLQGQTVIVRNDEIESVGPVESVPIPDGAFRIEGQGRFLMPGLADTHVHLTSATFANLRNDFILFLANGVTTVRVMWGSSGSVAERERIAQGEVLGPALLVASPGIDGPGGTWTASTPPVADAAEARVRVQEHVAMGVDFIKVYNDLTLAMYDAILDEAEAAGVPVVGHVPWQVGIEHVQDRGQLTLEHLIGIKLQASNPFNGGTLDLARARELAARSASLGIWHTPTVEVDALSVSRVSDIRASDALAHVSPGMRSFFETGFYHGLDDATASRERSNHLAILKLIHEAGGQPLVGTDAGFGWIVPGYSIHDELRHFVEAGLTPFQALSGATREAARAFRDLTGWGSVLEGSRADLILVNTNPLESVEAITNTSGVMVRGRWLSRGTLDAMLAQIRASYGT